MALDPRTSSSLMTSPSLATAAAASSALAAAVMRMATPPGHTHMHHMPHPALMERQRMLPMASPMASPMVSTTMASNMSPEEEERLASSGHNTSSSSSGGDTPMSRTNQYKKIMKPLLERKRRARINKCLDELKDIMTVALQSQGENVAKLEKADILELTVRHLHKLQQYNRLTLNSDDGDEAEHRFRAGYSSCAQEAATFLLKSPGIDVRVSQRLLHHLTTVPRQNGAGTAVPRSALVGLHSPPPESGRGTPPPPRPSSNPTMSTLTVSIKPLRPDPIRLDPRRQQQQQVTESVWRPF